MQVSFVLTVLSDDQPGLVNTLSDVINEYAGNWSDSRMIHLSGKFAGLIKISVPEEQAYELIAELTSLQDDGIEIAIETIADDDENERQRQTIEVLGQDAPGIINAITNQLAELSVNIEELFSEQRSAAMSSEVLFYAKLEVSIPSDVQPSEVQEALEALPDQLMIDIDFS